VHLSSTPHCFGSNDSDQLTARVQDIFLPLNNVFDSLYIADIDLNEMVMTDSVHGVDHSCYSSGTSTLCAGRDGGGLGVLSDGGIAQPYDGSVLVPLIGANKKMCAGDYFTCRLDIFGDVSCWGDNSNLQIAAGIIPSYSSPQPVITSQDVTDIACLANSLCFIKDDQKVYCQGEIVAQGTPLQLLDLVADKFVKIKAGAQFFCAQTNNGKLYCTGDNTNSELGHSAASTDMTTGSLVMSNDNSSHAQRPVLDFGLGSNHGCASSYDSTIRKQRLWCWGSDRFGQVTGVGGGGPTNIFRKIGDAGPGIGEIVGGAKHTCIQYQGGVYCWGKGFALGFDINNNPAYGVLNPILPLVYR
jgi:hypothetical protein